MKRMTEGEQNIEHVACIIYENYLTGVQIFAINSGDGWGFDAHYGHEGEGRWTRVEGLRLSEDDLDAAIAMARALGLK